MSEQQLVRYRDTGGVLWIYGQPVDPDSKPPYIGSATVNRAADHIGSIEGLHARLTRRHLREITSLLLEHGYHYLYLDRPDGAHTVPMATLVTDGPWKGYWLLDLVEVRLSVRR